MGHLTVSRGPAYIARGIDAGRNGAREDRLRDQTGATSP